MGKIPQTIIIKKSILVFHTGIWLVEKHIICTLSLFWLVRKDCETNVKQIFDKSSGEKKTNKSICKICYFAAFQKPLLKC